MRNSNFKKAVAKPKKVIDSRFGLRKYYFNNNEKPRVAVYNTPGRGQNGESQN